MYKRKFKYNFKPVQLEVMQVGFFLNSFDLRFLARYKGIQKIRLMTLILGYFSSRSMIKIIKAGQMANVIKLRY